MKRRTFMIGSAAVLAEAALARPARANVPVPYSFDLQPPTTSREAFIKWAVENRGENPKTLAARWDRYVFLRANNDFANARNGRAFLLTPRDEFVLERDIARASMWRKTASHAFPSFDRSVALMPRSDLAAVFTA